MAKKEDKRGVKNDQLDSETASDFQARSGKEGRQAQQMARQVIRGRGFRIESTNARLQDIGVTVNIIAIDRQGNRWYFDVSGAFASGRPGLMREDTVWKTLGRAAVLGIKGYNPLVIATTNLPKPGTAGHAALRACSRHLFYDALEFVSDTGRARLAQYCVRGPKLAPLPGWWTADDLYGPVIPTVAGPGPRLLRRVSVDDVGIPDFPEGAPITAKRLPHRLLVYVPSRSRQGHSIDEGTRRATVDRVRRLLVDNYKGCTTHEARGAWVDPLGGVADEAVIAIESYCADPCTTSVLSNVVRMVLIDLDQDAVATIIDNEMVQWSRS